MLRRNPTKVELKLEDLQELDIKLKAELEARKGPDKVESSPTLETQKIRQEIIEERIGYNPRPRKPN
ncbi:anaphase-promoting complex subunit CDC26-like [Oratosquilla oratoria]|uniref:anaphase-promoting complex subunit CDC26-like n=1 Tax=Oratosquilla oratoria TaxID=337810 RepID=UPI003F76EB4E